jgi:membrane-associated phospholipid phosphatase
LLRTLSTTLAVLKKSRGTDPEPCRQHLTGSVWRCGLVLFALLGAGVNAQAQPNNPVVGWNRILLTIVRTPGAQPATIHSTRSFAIMHAAIYDAVNSIQSTNRPYLVQLPGISPSASKDAAAVAAAHEVLVNLYPKFQAMLDAQLQQWLAEISDGGDKTDGISVGQIAADRILAFRSNDGSNATPPTYVFGNGPGDYQSTPPNFPKQPQFFGWRHVTPFALNSANQFRPGPPPALTSDAYTAVFNEIKAVGIANSSTATVDQALTGRFWNGTIQNYWNEIAQTAALKEHLNTPHSARLFALLNLTFADGAIALYDAKYAYNFWRPVTAIRAADIDNNSNTVADATWLPEVTNTPPDPSYPGAHAVISAAGAAVLEFFFHRDRFDLNVTSEVLPGVVRSFDSFSAAAEEASLSRVFAGVHFRSDEVTGQVLGGKIAQFVVDNFMIHIGGPSDESGDLSLVAGAALP